MAKVPFLDLRAAVAELREELDDAYRRVMASGRFLLGGELAAFEAEFAAACGRQHCVGVANGLDALHLSLRAMAIGPGDEVIVPAHTFIATWLAVVHAGARPVPVDAVPGGFDLDPDKLAAACGSATRAIVPVHLYGAPAAMEEICGFAQQRGLVVVADAAQAHGATLGGKPAGSFGTAAAFSFYPGKNLGAFGDAGAVVTDDADLAARLRALRNYGGEKKYDHLLQGFNSRLGELQAAFLRARLTRLPEWNERRRQHAAAYLEMLATAPGLRLPDGDERSRSSWHLFVVRHAHRDCLQRWLAEAGIETLVHYPTPVHRTPAFAAWAPHSLPCAEQLAREVLSLPMGPHLRTEQVGHVAARVNEFCHHHAGHDSRLGSRQRSGARGICG